MPRIPAAALMLILFWAFSSYAYAQAVPDPKINNPDQIRRDRTEKDGGAIDKPKAEIEIFTGPDASQPSLRGIVIAPEEPAKPEEVPAPPAEKPTAPAKKEENY